ncbi:MAG: pyruvate kinase [Bacteroidota bacterium]|nr:pyruvate kinase [Candidatus Kapabacteria bacterium]MCX7937426.1 pyruvate kinase [Chlorobiota bacterium]MDW8075786.1 pyruvate kinase [Bacteroidota bacterium]
MKTPRNFLAKTKILCTVGPAIGTTEKLIAAISAGASAFRLNMSHSTHDVHRQYITAIRAAEKVTGMHIPIVVDLQGPKLRVGDLGNGLTLIAGREVILADPHTVRRKRLSFPPDAIPVEYPTIAKDLKRGDTVLFDDGLLSVEVTDVQDPFVKAVVVHGGTLRSRKGINLPNVNISTAALTAKDRRDLDFAIAEGADYVAVSFVRSAKDIEQVRRYLAHRSADLGIIAKIEKPEAVAAIDEIIATSDAIMVARGDLGVEIPAALVPLVQKRIIARCNAYGKPVITATQMLESMVTNPRPTRAEASDVANAVLDGTDCVMLSAETSVGAYPIEAIATMRTICTEAERELLSRRRPAETYQRIPSASTENTDAIAAAAALIAENRQIDCIATLSYSGETARLVACRRPRSIVLAVSTVPETLRRVGLYWGVYGMKLDEITTTDETIEHIKKLLVGRGYFSKGATVLFTIGRPLVARSRTNMLSIETL